VTKSQEYYIVLTIPAAGASLASEPVTISRLVENSLSPKSILSLEFYGASAIIQPSHRTKLLVEPR